MKSETKNLFEIHNHLHTEEPQDIVNKISDNIYNLEDIGYAGYLEKKWLKSILKRMIMDSKGHNQPYSYKKEYNEKIKLACKDVIQKCNLYITDKIHIFFFPTFNKFTIEKMEGISGFSSWKNTILIFINFNNLEDDWELYLKETISHELAHALSPYPTSEFPVGSCLIFEGLAENFKEFIFPQNHSKWVTAISESKARKIFNEIQPILYETDSGKYKELFFGSKRYPLWSGYTIGYILVKNYLKKHKTSDRNKLLRIDPKKILERITI